MSVTVKTLNEGFNRRYVEDKRIVPAKDNVRKVIDAMDYNKPTFTDKLKSGYKVKWGGRNFKSWLGAKSDEEVQQELDEIKNKTGIQCWLTRDGYLVVPFSDKQDLKEWQSSKESGFTDGNRIFVKVDLSGVDNSQFISNMIGRNLSSLRLPPVLLEDNSDGTYALVFPGIADFKKLIEDNLDLTGLPYEISEDQYFSN